MYNNLSCFLMITTSIVLFNLTSLNFYKKNNVNKRNTNKYEYNKMYRIIELAGGLDKDPYNRKISSKVVYKFCNIAKTYSIDLNNITDEQFDFIYKKYTEYLIKKYTNYSQILT
jgi:hypothetical protein